MIHIEAHPPIEHKTPRMLGVEPTLHANAMIYQSTLGSWVEIGRNSMIVESTVGDYTYTDGDVSIIYTTVGKFCSIASHVRINPGNHPMERVSQHHFTYRRKQFGFDTHDDDAFFDWRRAHACTIGHDVWIGHAATVMAGVSVGIGAVIGAGAVVTKDVAPYQIVGGIPARPIRARFPDDVIEKLMAIAWWDWDRATLEARFEDFLDMPTFPEKYTPSR